MTAYTVAFLIVQINQSVNQSINQSFFNRLIATLKQQSNGPSYSNTLIIGTLVVDGWAVTFGTARSGLGGLRRCAMWPYKSKRLTSLRPGSRIGVKCSSCNKGLNNKQTNKAKTSNMHMFMCCGGMCEVE